VCGEELYWDDSEQPRQDKNILYRHDEPKEPIREGPLSFVLHEIPFASVSTVSRSHPTLVSLFNILHVCQYHILNRGRYLIHAGPATWTWLKMVSTERFSLKGMANYRPLPSCESHAKTPLHLVELLENRNAISQLRHWDNGKVSYGNLINKEKSLFFLDSCGATVPLAHVATAQSINCATFYRPYILKKVTAPLATGSESVLSAIANFCMM
jgi:hypothetical protein